MNSPTKMCSLISREEKVSRIENVSCRNEWEHWEQFIWLACTPCNRQLGQIIYMYITLYRSHSNLRTVTLFHPGAEARPKESKGTILQDIFPPPLRTNLFYWNKWKLSTGATLASLWWRSRVDQSLWVTPLLTPPRQSPVSRATGFGALCSVPHRSPEIISWLLNVHLLLEKILSNMAISEQMVDTDPGRYLFFTPCSKKLISTWRWCHPAWNGKIHSWFKSHLFTWCS